MNTDNTAVSDEEKETVAPLTDATEDSDTEETIKSLRKKELVNQVVNRSGVRKPIAKSVVEAMLDILGETLAEGREMNLQPLGKVKINRSKEIENARIMIAKIRQPIVEPEEETAEEKSSDEDAV